MRQINKGRKVMHYIIVAILLVSFIILWARWFERSNIYFPDKIIVTTPASIGLAYEDVYFNTQDGVRLNGWFIPASAAARGTLLYCHGNAGNISHRLEIIRMLNSLGLNVFIFDYRGYGRSDGTPSEKGTYRDALAAYKYLLSKKNIDNAEIIIYGKSLGGAVAADLASKADVRVIILDSSFTSVADMAKEIYPFLPTSLFITNKYDTLSKVGSIDEPKLIIHSREDRAVPYHHGEKIFAASSEPKEFYHMKGGHNEAIIEYADEYKERIDAFLKKNGM